MKITGINCADQCLAYTARDTPHLHQHGDEVHRGGTDTPQYVDLQKWECRTACPGRRVWAWVRVNRVACVRSSARRLLSLCTWSWCLETLSVRSSRHSPSFLTVVQCPACGRPSRCLRVPNALLPRGRPCLVLRAVSEEGRVSPALGLLHAQASPRHPAPGVPP